MKKYSTASVTYWENTNSYYIYYFESKDEELIRYEKLDYVIGKLNSEGYFISAIEGNGMDKILYFTKEVFVPIKIKIE